MVKKAQQAKIKLEQHINEPKTAKLQSVKQQHQHQTQVKLQQQNPPQSKKKATKHSRLIIRNLVYDINEKHIRKLLTQYGQIKQINIPNHPDKKTSKGFAFVQMGNRNQCLKAIKMLNGTNYKGRTIVLDMAVSKENYMMDKLNYNLKKMGRNEAKKENNDDHGQLQQQQEHMQNQQNDDAEYKKQQANIKREENQSSPQVQNEMQNQQQNDGLQQQQQQQQQRLIKQRQDHLHQIFIRNIPISTTQQDLFKHFVRYGKIDFVKLVINKQTNLSKGSAFIKYANAEISKKLIQYSRDYQQNFSNKNKNFIINPNISLQIDGVIVKIFPVQTRSDIEHKLKLREGEGRQLKPRIPLKKIKRLQDLIKTDIHGKRKLALGLIGRWKAEQSMNKYDYEMFKNHEKQKIQKLKNTNFSISQLRIILKHLDGSITQQKLKEIATNFLIDRNASKNLLVYCKLMLDRKMKKSTGFAFIEFKKHQIAKQFIQYLIKNKSTLQNKLFIIQFAIQNSKTLLKLKKRSQKYTKNSIDKQNLNKPHNHKSKRIKKQKKCAYPNKNSQKLTKNNTLQFQ